MKGPFDLERAPFSAAPQEGSLVNYRSHHLVQQALLLVRGHARRTVSEEDNPPSGQNGKVVQHPGRWTRLSIVPLLRGPDEVGSPEEQECPSWKTTLVNLTIGRTILPWRGPGRRPSSSAVDGPHELAAAMAVHQPPKSRRTVNPQRATKLPVPLPPPSSSPVPAMIIRFVSGMSSRAPVLVPCSTMNLYRRIAKAHVNPHP